MAKLKLFEKLDKVKYGPPFYDLTTDGVSSITVQAALNLWEIFSQVTKVIKEGYLDSLNDPNDTDLLMALKIEESTLKGLDKGFSVLFNKFTEFLTSYGLVIGPTSIGFAKDKLSKEQVQALEAKPYVDDQENYFTVTSESAQKYEAKNSWFTFTRGSSGEEEEGGSDQEGFDKETGSDRESFHSESFQPEPSRKEPDEKENWMNFTPMGVFIPELRNNKDLLLIRKLVGIAVERFKKGYSKPMLQFARDLEQAFVELSHTDFEFSLQKLTKLGFFK